MLKRYIVFMTVLAFALAGALVAFAELKLPEQVDLSVYAKKRPVAEFGHNKHVEEFKLDCKTCHHKMKEGDTSVKKCSAEGCHGPRKVGKTPSLQSAFHKNCKTCHKKEQAAGKKGAPTKCKECHVKK